MNISGWKDFPEFSRWQGRRLFVSENFSVDTALPCCFTSWQFAGPRLQGM